MSRGVTQRLCVSPPRLCATSYELCIPVSIDHTSQPILKSGASKIDQQSHPEIEDSEISQHLFRVDGVFSFNRFHLHNHLPLDQEIQAEGLGIQDSVPFEGNPPLTLHCETALDELLIKDRLIDRLEKPWAEFSVGHEGLVDNGR